MIYPQRLVNIYETILLHEIFGNVNFAFVKQWESNGDTFYI